MKLGTEIPVESGKDASHSRALLRRLDLTGALSILLLAALSIFLLWSRYARETDRLWEQARVETVDAASQQASATVQRGETLGRGINRMEMSLRGPAGGGSNISSYVRFRPLGKAQGLPAGLYSSLERGGVAYEVAANPDFGGVADQQELVAAVSMFREFSVDRRNDPALTQFIYASATGRLLVSAQVHGERLVPLLLKSKVADEIDTIGPAIAEIRDHFWPSLNHDIMRRQGFEWVALYKGDQLPVPLSRVAGSVKRDGEPTGALAVIYRADDLYPLHRQPPVLGRMYMVSNDGTIAADSTRTTAQLKLPEQLPDALMNGLKAAIASPGRPVDFGLYRFVAAPIVASPDYYILLAAPRSAARVAVMREMVVLTSMLLLGLLLVAAMLLYVRRSFMLPAVRLLEGISRPGNEALAPNTHPAWLPWARQIDDSRADAIRHLHEIETQARFTEAVVNTAIDCIITADEHGVITGFNPAAERVFGWTSTEIIGCLLDDTIIPNHHREGHRKGMARMLEGGNGRVIGKRVELEGLRKDGSLFPLELALAEASVDGERRFIAYLRDLSTQRDAEAERNALRSQLEAFFDNVPASMYLRDPKQNRFVMYNRWGAKMLGMKPEDVVGSSFDDYRHLIGTDNSLNLDDAIYSTGKAITSEQVYHLPQGDRTGMVTHFPVKDAEGNIDFIGGMIFDISDYKRTEAELLSSRESLHQSEKLAALGQLLAGVAHELNNPLAIVVGRASMLRDKLVGTPHEPSLDKLRAAADRCSRIVKTFLAMARQSGPRRSLVDINELVEGALDMTAYGLRTAGITVEQMLSDDVPLTNADGDQIVQVLINLIINAQHAMEAKGKGGTLTIGTRPEPAKKLLVIDVADTGPGVPKDIASRIFDPFFTTKDVGAGTGMGLSVSKGMIEAQGGSLELVRNSSKGATFQVSVPLRSADEAPDDEPAETRPEPAAGHILIVDDEPDIAEMLAECLQPAGLETTIVGDGKAALDALSRQSFDAVFTDVRMPGMDGLALYAAIKADHPSLAKRVAFISGDVLQADPARAAAMDGQPLIEKPFDPDHIRAVAIDLIGAGDVK